MECWFIWNARLSFWEAEFCCLLFTVLKISSHQWPAAEKLRCREGRWNEILGPQQKRVTLQSSLTVCCVNFYFKIFSVSPAAQDWFLSPLLPCPLKIKTGRRLLYLKFRLLIYFPNWKQKLPAMIARKVCDFGMECFIILSEGQGNFSPCLTLNSRDLKGPARGYIVTLLETDLYFYICCIFQFIWFLLQLTQGRATDSWNWIIFLQSVRGVKNENNNLSELLATSI